MRRITKKSADLFNEYAAYDYAKQCEIDGSEEKLKEALHYYSSAAALGHYAAALDTARCYQLGIGCDENSAGEAATIYYHQAFDDKVRSYESLGKLADFFAQGVRVPKNYVFAYALSNFAGAAGNDYASALRDYLETKMSPEQIGKAQDMTHEWNDLSQIKDHKFFPDWMREPPEYTLLQEEAKIKKLNEAERDAGIAKWILNLFEANKLSNKGNS